MVVSQTCTGRLTVMHMRTVKIRTPSVLDLVTPLAVYERTSPSPGAKITGLRLALSRSGKSDLTQGLPSTSMQCGSLRTHSQREFSDWGRMTV